MPCFVVFVYGVVWSLCSTIVVCRCIMIVVCCFGAIRLCCCAVFLSWFVGVLRDHFFVLPVCPFLLYCSFALLFVFSLPLLLLTYKHKKPYHFCFAIGYKKTRIYSGLVLKIKVNYVHYYSYY